MQQSDRIIATQPENEIHRKTGHAGRDVTDQAWPLLLETTMIGKDRIDGPSIATPLPDDAPYPAFRNA